MAFVQQSYSAATAINVSTFDSLASNTYGISTALDSTVTGAISATIDININFGGGVSFGDYIAFYIARSLDNINFDTIGNNLQALACFTEVSSSAEQIFSIDTGILGTLPPYWKLVVFNGTSDLFSTGNSASLTWKILEDTPV